MLINKVCFSFLTIISNNTESNQKLKALSEHFASVLVEEQRKYTQLQNEHLGVMRSYLNAKNDNVMLQQEIDKLKQANMILTNELKQCKSDLRGAQTFVTRKNSISKKGPFTLEYRILVAELVAMEVSCNSVSKVITKVAEYFKIRLEGGVSKRNTNVNFVHFAAMLTDLITIEHKNEKSYALLNDGTTKNYTKYWDTILNTSTGPRVLGKEF